MKIGLVGLGKMGGKMRERITEHGHEVIGYDANPAISDVATIEELVAGLGDGPVVWVMVPAGDVTEKVIEEVASAMGGKGLIIDGGNSRFSDSIRRNAGLADRGIGFIDAGTSGGVWGLTEGYCLMVGGTEGDVATAQPIFDALAPEGGFAHMGPAGTGHYTKMVHNAIEYGIMQSYAEGYELLGECGMEIDPAKAVKVWRSGSVIRSWLLDLLDRAIDEDPGLTKVEGWAEDSGEGRWTVIEAVDHAVPMPAISAALYARFASRQDDSEAMKVIAALRNQFGGHAVVTEGDK